MFLTAIDSSLKKEVKKEKPIETKIEIKVPEQQIENLNPSIMSIPKKTKDLKGEKKTSYLKMNECMGVNGSLVMMVGV